MHNIRNINKHKRDTALKYNMAFICRVCKEYMSIKLYMTEYDMCLHCYNSHTYNFGTKPLYIKDDKIDYADSAPWKLDIGVT